MRLLSNHDTSFAFFWQEVCCPSQVDCKSPKILPHTLRLHDRQFGNVYRVIRTAMLRSTTPLLLNSLRTECHCIAIRIEAFSNQDFHGTMRVFQMSSKKPRRNLQTYSFTKPWPPTTRFLNSPSPPGQKGPGGSHYHLDGGREHFSPRPGDSNPGFGR